MPGFAMAPCNGGKYSSRIMSPLHLVTLCLLVASLTHHSGACVAPLPEHRDYLGDAGALRSSLHLDGATSTSTRSKREVTIGDRPNCETTSSRNPTAVDTSDRLSRLRTEMRRRRLSAYIIPTNDQHQSEYVSEYDKRREYISGFSGSQGIAVVTSNKSALWTDGRYFLQAEAELDCNWLLMKQRQPGTPSISEWLVSELSDGQRVSLDPKLVSFAFYDELSMKLSKGFVTLVPEPQNLIDVIWTGSERPRPPNEPAFVLGLEFTGKTWRDKVSEIRREMASTFAENTRVMMIVTALDEVAWLFNLRGSDIPYNPVFFAYALITNDKVNLYIDSSKVTDEVRSHLRGVNNICHDQICTTINAYGDIFNDINREATYVDQVLVSPQSSYGIYSSIPSEKRKVQQSVIMLTKAQKNAVETQGMKDSHVRDAVALISFMAMLEREVKEGKEWDETAASLKLDEYRKEQQHNKGASFETISASGSNGAVIHYAPRPNTNKLITTSDMYLLDSGGQYLDGTTDVTRTFHFGNPTEWMKECYTRVLMGSIDMAQAVFPYNSVQSEIDAIARAPLWRAGLDYLHGTSHGIGHFLHVHEGPTTDPLLPGIFMSDEPGYYEAGAFGIRLETIVYVVKAETPATFNVGDKFYQTYEAVTLVPFEPNLIKESLLTNKQITWLNDYNAQIRREVGDMLRSQGRDEGYTWMLERTRPIQLHSSEGCPDRNVAHVAAVSATSLLLIVTAFYVGKLL